MEISKDESFGIRYANFVSIIKIIENYLSHHADVDKFTSSSLKGFLIINDILKNEQNQLLILSEILIFLSSISSRKDYYLEKVGELENSLCEAFFQIIEKYIFIDNDAINQSRSMIQDKSGLGTSLYVNKSDKDKANLIQIIKDSEAKISSLKQYIESLEKTKEHLELMYNDKEREIEMLKKSQSKNYQIQEQLINNTITHSELKTEIVEKNLEIEELKKELQLTNDRAKEKIKKLTESLELAKDKITDFEGKQVQYEKLNAKYKELQGLISNKGFTKEEMMNIMDEKNKNIELLMKEKNALLGQIEKLGKDIIKEKEKSTKVEFEKKKLEFELTDVKNEIIHIKEKEKEEIIKRESQKDLSSIGGYPMEGILDISKDNKINKELLSIKSSNIEFHASDDVIQKLKDENIKIQSEIAFLKEKNENLLKDKEILEVKNQRLELDKQKLSLSLDRTKNENKNLGNENNCLNEKLKTFNMNKKKEIDQLKSELKAKTELIETMLAEKKNAINEYKKLQKEFDLYKQNQITQNEKKAQAKTSTGFSNNTISSSSGSIQQIYNSEVLGLKNEIQNLKLQHLQKDEQIRQLQESLEESQNNKNENNLTEEEINTKLADLDFYKKSYEEQKARVNREHELISDSLYKLAVHFMSLKDNLQKKMKNK